MINKNIFRSGILMFAILGFFACVDDDFDNPPSEITPPDIQANTTIAELKAMHIEGEFEEVTSDIIVSGVVTANDIAGNIFKEIYVEDATGAVRLSIDDTDLYTRFALGREVFIKAQGLWTGDDDGILTLGEEPASGNNFVTRIPPSLVEQFIIFSVERGVKEPLSITIPELFNAQNGDKKGQIIRIEQVQIPTLEIGQTFAVPNGGSGRNRSIEDCDGNTVILRNSDFSDFAADTMPSGSGPIIAIFSSFGGSPQLEISQASDLDFGTGRCDDGPVSTDGLISIKELRALASGSGVIPADSKVIGQVLSDGSSANIVDQNMVVQDTSGRGIVFRFTDAHNVPQGTFVQVNVSGQVLSEFNGLMQVSDLDLGAVRILNEGIDIVPNPVSVDQILAAPEDFESTLVALSEVNITGSSTYSGGTTVTDATGSIPMFTRSQSNFASAPVPNEPTDMVAIVSDFNGVQLNIRNLDDVEKEGDGGGGGNDWTNGEGEMTIEALRGKWMGSVVSSIPSPTSIKGVVISDGPANNLDDNNVVIQDASGFGIVVRFVDPHSFSLGEYLEIDIAGAELSEFNSLLQVNNTDLGKAQSISGGPTINPQVLTVQQVLDGGEDLESTLIQIEDVVISGSSTYSGSTEVSDATATIPMFTRSAAVFADDSVPSGEATITAIVSEFQGARQINIRNKGDVVE